MRKLLRSLFVADPSDNPDFLLRNFSKFADSGLVFDIAQDKAIFDYIKRFTQTHQHVPEFKTLSAHFKRIKEDEVLDRLDVLKRLPTMVQGAFVVELEHEVANKRLLLASQALNDANQILTVGMEIKEGKERKMLKGPQDAMHFLLERSHEIVMPSSGVKISGDATKEGDMMRDRYLTIESDPLAGIGQMTGLMQMDQKLQGAQRKELWVHAAFTGGMKTTTAINWLYNQAVYFHESSALYSLEQPYGQCLNQLYAMHSFHGKFKGIRTKLGLQATEDVDMGLDYADIKFGRLKPAEKEFYLNHVIPDFNDPRNEYGSIHIKCADPQTGAPTIAELRRDAETLYSKHPFNMIIVDHAKLVKPSRYFRSELEGLNEVYMHLKQMALYFNRGQGIAVVSLHQINRDGYNKAVKMKEKTGLPLYTLTALADANEAERSADKVTTSFVDDEYKERARVLYQCLKSRDLEAFAPFFARVEWPCRRILTLLPTEQDMDDDELDAQIQSSYAEFESALEEELNA